MTEREEIHYGSGNVFADLGFPNPEEHQIKAGLVSHISDLIKKRRMTQTAAAKAFGIDQPKVSAMLRGQFRGFSVYRLMCFIAALGHDVDIVVKRKPRSRAQGETHVIL